MDAHRECVVGGEEALEQAGRVGFGMLAVADGAAPVAALLPFPVAMRVAARTRDHRTDADHVAIASTSLRRVVLSFAPLQT